MSQRYQDALARFVSNDRHKSGSFSLRWNVVTKPKHLPYFTSHKVQFLEALNKKNTGKSTYDSRYMNRNQILFTIGWFGWFNKNQKSIYLFVFVISTIVWNNNGLNTLMVLMVLELNLAEAKGTINWMPWSYYTFIIVCKLRRIEECSKLLQLNKLIQPRHRYSNYIICLYTQRN